MQDGFRGLLRRLASVLAAALALSAAPVLAEGGNPLGTRILAPTSGTINNLVVFIRFSDQPEFTQPLSYYDGLFNSANNSLKNFYLENSYRALTVNSTFYPSSAGPLVSYQDAHPTAYYQPYNASSNPLGYQGAEATARELALVSNALNAVSAQIPAGLNLDGNNDGYIDHITFEVYSTNANPLPVLFYSRASYDSSGSIVINGKNVGAYTWVTASQDAPTTGVNLGSTEIHEMGHSFGYPDLRDNSGRTPVGDWDVMSLGRPVHSGAYMKYRFTNWIANIPTIAAYGAYTLNDLTQSTNNAYKLAIPNSSEFLVLEYRKSAGAFEGNLFGSGLCVTRVNEAAGIWGNLDGPPYFLYYYRVDGTTSSDGTGNAWVACFSAETGRTQFTDHSNPACFLSDGSACGIAITGIGSTAGSSIGFTVSDPNAVTITHSISGYLYNGGNRVSGASVTLSGDASATVTTDSLGRYVFTANAGGTYTVTPGKANLSFTPASKTFANLASDQVQNFAAANNTNTISGSVTLAGSPLSGATVYCSGGNYPAPVTTDASGTFTFTVYAGSDYTVFAGKSGYYIYPANKAFTNLTTDQTQNFTAQAITATTLASSTNPSVSGQAVTFTATVAGSSPGGTVTFSNFGVPLCAAAPVANGQAQCTSSALGAGNQGITAAYSGDNNNASSTSATLTQVVTALVTTTTTTTTATSTTSTTTTTAATTTTTAATTTTTIAATSTTTTTTTTTTAARTSTTAATTTTTLPITTTTTTTTQRTTSSSVATTTSTTLPSTTTTVTTTTSTSLQPGAIDLLPGWNLLGNSVNVSINVAGAFGDTAQVTTVWKWLPASGAWAFYAPGLADGGAAYAASKGYLPLAVIAAGEGFWVYANAAFTAQLPAGTALASAAFAALPSGWSLVAVGDSPTASGFNNALGAGTLAGNLVSLWAWDNRSARWYFYAPSLEAQGGTALADYIAGKAYLDFAASGKKLEPGVGFWVNR